MSVDDLKKAVTRLSTDEQNELSAFLFHLRHRGDPAYQAAVEDRLGDKDPSHWLNPDEFDKRVDKKHGIHPQMTQISPIRDQQKSV